MCELSEYGALFLCTPMKPALIQGSVTIKIDHSVLRAKTDEQSTKMLFEFVKLHSQKYNKNRREDDLC